MSTRRGWLVVFFLFLHRTAEEKARKEMVVAAVQLMDKPNDMWREEREKTRKERGRACEWHSRGGSWRRQLNWAGLSLGTVGGCSHSLARRLATSCKRLAKQKASDGETIKSLLTQQIIPPLRRAVDATANKQ